MEREALNKIRQIKQRYTICQLLADVLLALAIALVGAAIGALFFAEFLLLLIILFLIILNLLLANRRPWLVKNSTITAFLDARYPELEESSSIVLMQKTELNLLQQLQFKKVIGVLAHTPVHHKRFIKPLLQNALLLVCAFVFLFMLRQVNTHWSINKALGSLNSFNKNKVNELILPQIKTVEVLITPPAYTHLSVHQQSKFTLEIIEGAAINWKLTTNTSVKKVSLLFDERENLTLSNENNKGINWQARKVLIKSGFYQVLIDGKRSDLYRIQIVKDLPPIIQIKEPKQYTYIDAGEKPQVNLEATVTDDYGVSDAEIFATIAKGSGEGVKFKEQKISFPNSFNQNKRQYALKQSINLQTLNVEPGDDLYFYIQARDNHNQFSRTDVYIVSVQDTAQLLSMDGILAGTDIKPEYFRSERQIILDAEKLLKEKDTLRTDKFNEKSNELGTDQKLLRLRYGKFLGEEAEGSIDDPRIAGNEKPIDPNDFGNGTKILDAYTDKHDNAEDAQFFDPKVKEQLKATLTEMWKAELQLRLYHPKEALPFAYKALRLLKDLQQKSRSYVAKTTYNPSPLKMEKRLSGDLDKIIDPTEHRNQKPSEDSYAIIKNTLSILENSTRSNTISSSDKLLLQKANQLFIEKAAHQPDDYLYAVSAMNKIISGSKKGLSQNIKIIERAIQKLLPPGKILPQNTTTAADMGLSKNYFLNLNH
jgi:hypothetical protein